MLSGEMDKEMNASDEEESKIIYDDATNEISVSSELESTISRHFIEYNFEDEDNDNNCLVEIDSDKNFQQFSKQEIAEEITESRDTSIDSTEDQNNNATPDRTESMFEQRLRIIIQLKELSEEHGKIKLKNRFLNKKCCDYLKKTKAVNYFESIEGSLPIHGDQRYHAVLEDFEKTKIHFENTKPTLEQENENLSNSHKNHLAKLDDLFGEFVSREVEVGSECIEGKTGKVMSELKIRSMVKKQKGRSDALAEVRVRYLKLYNNLSGIQTKLRKVNLMGEGRTIMDYEQLTIINNTYRDKYDEREEELRKFRNRCTQNASILSQIKEASDSYVYDIINARKELNEITNKKSEARSLLAAARLKRDSLRKDYLHIGSTAGLLANPTLLRKMEIDLEKLADLKQKIQG